MLNKRKVLAFGALTAGAALTLAGPAGAEVADSFDRTVAEGSAAMNTIVLDNIFIFICGVLVFLMQPGFALLEAGLTQAKNVANIMMKNLMDVSVGVLFFALIGWNIAYSGATWFGFADGAWSIFGVADMAAIFPGDAGEVLANEDYPLAVPVDWFFQAAFAATAATIVSGAVAGRTQFRGYLLYTVVITALIYPIIVNLKWGGGWLDQQGFVDFAGSGVVHMTGGVAALMGAIVLGPRIGKFGEDGKPRAIPGHSMPLAITGVFILFIGWFGFNPGSQLQADMAVPYLAVQTALAAAAGGVFAMLTSWVLLKKPDVSMAGNGMLAGLVAICAGIGNMVSVGTVLTGAVAGILVVVGVLAIERLKVDDPVGAVATHGLCGAWGLIATGLFATTGSPVDDSVGGLFTGGGVDLLVDQLTGLVIIAVVVGVLSFALFSALKAAGVLRVSAEEELAGLDVAEHGAPGYGPDMLPAAPAQMG
jgi:ammonium transporter, Amt family